MIAVNIVSVEFWNGKYQVFDARDGSTWCCSDYKTAMRKVREIMDQFNKMNLRINGIIYAG